MKTLRLLARLAAAVALATALLTPATGLAESAVLTPAGVMYEVTAGHLSDIYTSSVGSLGGDTPVVLLRTIRPGAQPVLEIVDGTLGLEGKGSPSIGYDESTDTIFVVYMRYQGLMTDVHFAARRGGAWVERNILPSVGLYLSLNPQMVLTRQNYTDLGPDGLPVQKTRSIVSVVWWEEGGRSQARYAPVFIEDGDLHLDEITPYNLNELARADGPTNAGDLPFSSFQFPAVQRDPAGSGGVLVSFANLASRKQTTLRIGFPDDIRQIVASGVPAGPQAMARLHVPIGRSGGRDFRIIPINIQGELGTVIAPASLIPTFYWSDGGAAHVVRGDLPEDAPETVIPVRPDLTWDRAVSVVREAVLTN